MLIFLIEIVLMGPSLLTGFFVYDTIFNFPLSRGKEPLNIFLKLRLIDNGCSVICQEQFFAIYN